jgi:hypothetical protein
VLLQPHRYKVIQLAQRPALTVQALIDVSAKSLSPRVVISHSSPFLFTLVAIIATLGFLFGLWFGIPTHHALRPSYPYYDTHKLVPPWSEPAPLKGNHDKGGE